MYLLMIKEVHNLIAFCHSDCSKTKTLYVWNDHESKMKDIINSYD